MTTFFSDLVLAAVRDAAARGALRLADEDVRPGMVFLGFSSCDVTVTVVAREPVPDAGWPREPGWWTTTDARYWIRPSLGRWRFLGVDPSVGAPETVAAWWPVEGSER